MRKRIVGLHSTSGPQKSNQNTWLDLGQIATVEVTSEDPGFPIESVFASNANPGWRASQKGEQVIRIIFDEPVSVHQVRLDFTEAEFERTQEFTLRWSSATSGLTAEIVRQQWNFSPLGSTAETECYELDLERVSVLELAINPDVSRGQAVATLTSFRVG